MGDLAGRIMSGVEEGGGEPSSGSTPDKNSSDGVSPRSRLGSYDKCFVPLAEKNTMMGTRGMQVRFSCFSPISPSATSLFDYIICS